MQSVAVKMVLEREREIQSFEPEEYWSLRAYWEQGRMNSRPNLPKNNKKLTISNEQEMEEVLEEIKGAVFL